MKTTTISPDRAAWDKVASPNWKWPAEAGAREIRLNLGELRRLLTRGASICEKWMAALLRRPEIFAQIDFVCAE